MAIKYDHPGGLVQSFRVTLMYTCSLAKGTDSDYVRHSGPDTIYTIYLFNLFALFRRNVCDGDGEFERRESVLWGFFRWRRFGGIGRRRFGRRHCCIRSHGNSLQGGNAEEAQKSPNSALVLRHFFCFVFVIIVFFFWILFCFSLVCFEIRGFYSIY